MHQTVGEWHERNVSTFGPHQCSGSLPLEGRAGEGVGRWYQLQSPLRNPPPQGEGASGFCFLGDGWLLNWLRGPVPLTRRSLTATGSAKQQSSHPPGSGTPVAAAKAPAPLAA